jgi:hypothetical protein
MPPRRGDRQLSKRRQEKLVPLLKHCAQYG